MFGEMKNVGRHAVFLCLCFMACLLLDSFIPAREAGHDCSGESCPVCAQIETARSSAGNAVSPNAAFSRLFAETSVRRGAPEGRDARRRLSPAELMVKLTC
jgi:hypothetical protein